MMIVGKGGTDEEGKDDDADESDEARIMKKRRQNMRLLIYPTAAGVLFAWRREEPQTHIVAGEKMR